MRHASGVQVLWADRKSIRPTISFAPCPKGARVSYEPLSGTHLPFSVCLSLQDQLLRRESTLIFNCTFVYKIVLIQLLYHCLEASVDSPLVDVPHKCVENCSALP